MEVKVFLRHFENCVTFCLSIYIWRSQSKMWKDSRRGGWGWAGTQTSLWTRTRGCPEPPRRPGAPWPPGSRWGWPPPWSRGHSSWWSRGWWWGRWAWSCALRYWCPSSHRTHVLSGVRPWLHVPPRPSPAAYADTELGSLTALGGCQGGQNNLVFQTHNDGYNCHHLLCCVRTSVFFRFLQFRIVVNWD